MAKVSHRHARLQYAKYGTARRPQKGSMSRTTLFKTEENIFEKNSRRDPHGMGSAWHTGTTQAEGRTYAAYQTPPEQC
jgi:hypothetical protein